MVKIAVTFFLLLNSIGTLPLFIGLTHGLTPRKRCMEGLIAGLTAMMVLLVFIWSGDALMRFFGLSIPAFEIGGGILLFMIGMEMLNCSVDPEKAIRRIQQCEIVHSNAIVPMGIPLLAGPGSIAVSMTITLGAMEGVTPIGVSMALALAMVGTMVVWLGGGHLFTKVDIKPVSELLARFGGLFLVVLAVQMVINGYREVCVPVMNAG